MASPQYYCSFHGSSAFLQSKPSLLRTEQIFSNGPKLRDTITNVTSHYLPSRASTFVFQLRLCHPINYIPLYFRHYYCFRSPSFFTFFSIILTILLCTSSTQIFALCCLKILTFFSMHATNGAGYVIPLHKRPNDQLRKQC